MPDNGIYILLSAGEHCAFLHIFFTSPWPYAMAWRSKYSSFLCFLSNSPLFFLFCFLTDILVFFTIRQLSLGLFMQRICWEINQKDCQLMLSKLVQERQIRVDWSLEFWKRSKLICIQWASIVIQWLYCCKEKVQICTSSTERCRRCRNFTVNTPMKILWWNLLA